jgi:phosphotransferase system HPr-like phosphotransfer protein
MVFPLRAAAAAAYVFLALSSGAHAEPANTLHDMWERFQACLTATHGSDELANESEITILFTLRRDGSQFGQPRITIPI